MIRMGEDELICDLAETYGILDYKQLPARRVAVFCVGLHQDARIKRKMADEPHELYIVLMCQILDALNFLAWTKTADAARGVNRPLPVLRPKETCGFGTAEEYERERAKLIKEVRERGDRTG